jgi:hypothetical protein
MRNSAPDRCAPKGFEFMKTIPDKYTKDVIEESYAQGKAEWKTKEDFQEFNILRVASKDVTNTKYLENLYYEVEIGGGRLVRFMLQKYKARPMKMYAKGKKDCKEVKGHMLKPEWVMSYASIIETSK